MAAKRQFQSRRHTEAFIFICAVTAALSGTFLFATEQAGTSTPARYRVFMLRHISAEQGKKYLAEAEVGTVSQLPSPNTLLVTAQPAELIKASNILRLVDAEEEFVIKTIFPSTEVKTLPSNEQIAAEVGEISIGTFFEPPTTAAKTKAIIDIHNDAVMVIAPARQLEKIISAIEQLQDSVPGLVSREPNEPRATSDEPQDTNESNELFEELLESLAEAERMAVELGIQQPARPNEPATQPSAAVTIPEQKQPSKPSVVEALESKDAVEKPKPEPQPEPALEQAVVETEQPAEAAEPAAKRWSYEPEPIANGDEMLELDLPEKLNIVDLLSLAGEYLYLDYMYDPTKVKGGVTLKLRGPIKVKDLYPLLESVLKFKGFVMTRKGNLVTIVPAAEALGIDPALHTEVSKLTYGQVIITRVFTLKHIDTTSATNLLKGMGLSVDITPIAEAGTLIITGYAYRMTRIEELLEMIDKPGAPRVFRFRQLKYTMAKTLAPKIKTLAEQLGTISVTIAAAPVKPVRGRKPPPRAVPAQVTKPAVYLDADERTNRILMIGLQEQLVIVDELIDTLDVAQQDLRVLRLYEIQYVGAEEVVNKLGEFGIVGGARPTAARAKAAKPRTPAPTAEALVEQPQVVIIESTNSLLVNATDEQHTQIAVIIGYVDSETLEQAIPYVIYSLENQDPEDLAEVLQKLIQETIKDKEGKIQKVVKKGEDIIIVPDENTFSIIVYASRKNQEWISKLIKDLDKRRPQVLIDVTLVEISEVDAFTYDLQLVSKFPKLIRSGSMDKLTALLTPFPLKTVTEVFSILGEGGSAKGFYADRHIQALLELMQKKGYGRVLARPKILVNDNETGHIDSTSTIYVARTSETTGDVGQVIVSTSFTFDQFPSGITLDITPHISEGDLLRLEIKMSRSSQIAPEGGIKENEPPPDKIENNIETIVTVPDNSTIILGGILTLDQLKENWKVPLLGDIPLIGGLFRKIDNSSRQTRLYVFVRANILRPSETEPGLPDLERISDRDRMVFEKYEHELQEYEQWPGVKPKPMEPKHVLQVE